MDNQIHHLKKGLRKARRMNLVLMICILFICLIMLIYIAQS